MVESKLKEKENLKGYDVSSKVGEERGFHLLEKPGPREGQEN